MLTPHLATELITATLRKEAPSWPGGRDTSDVAIFTRQMRLHGVGGLLSTAPRGTGWPAEVCAELRAEAVRNLAWEAEHMRFVRQTLATLSAAEIHPVLIKGSALAYTIYPDGAWRSRSDTDMVVPECQRHAAEAVLTRAGYRRDNAMSGDVVSYQANYTQAESFGSRACTRHTIDLHWRINNSELLASVIDHAELRRRARSVPALGPAALAPSIIHSMLLACMHRMTHVDHPYFVDGVAHYSADRLIWLYDIHLLAGKFSAGHWEEFCALADERGLAGCCLDGLHKAQEAFGTAVPGDALQALARPVGTEQRTLYLASTRMRRQWMDFAALGTLPRRLRFVSETLFPPAAYMLEKYNEARVRWLPWLYMRRAFTGFAKALALRLPS